MPMPRAYQGKISPDGKRIAYRMNNSWDEERRNYRGGQNRPIWILDLDFLRAGVTAVDRLQGHGSGVGRRRRVLPLRPRRRLQRLGLRHAHEEARPGHELHRLRREDARRGRGRARVRAGRLHSRARPGQRARSRRERHRGRRFPVDDGAVEGRLESHDEPRAVRDGQARGGRGARRDLHDSGREGRRSQPHELERLGGDLARVVAGWPLRRVLQRQVGRVQAVHRAAGRADAAARDHAAGAEPSVRAGVVAERAHGSRSRTRTSASGSWTSRPATRKLPTPIRTSTADRSIVPVWSPDSRWIAYPKRLPSLFRAHLRSTTSRRARSSRSPTVWPMRRRRRGTPAASTSGSSASTNYGLNSSRARHVGVRARDDARSLPDGAGEGRAVAAAARERRGGGARRRVRRAQPGRDMPPRPPTAPQRSAAAGARGRDTPSDRTRCLTCSERPRGRAGAHRLRRDPAAHHRRAGRRAPRLRAAARRRAGHGVLRRAHAADGHGRRVRAQAAPAAAAARCTATSSARAARRRSRRASRSTSSAPTAGSCCIAPPVAAADRAAVVDRVAVVAVRCSSWTPTARRRRRDRVASQRTLRAYVDPKEEFQQIFNEGWRNQRNNLYVQNAHGTDWPAMQKMYEPLLQHVNHRADLNYLMDNMGAEIAVGHSYVRGGDMPEVPTANGGLLGADFTRRERPLPHRAHLRRGELEPGAARAAGDAGREREPRRLRARRQRRRADGAGQHLPAARRHGEPADGARR